MITKKALSSGRAFFVKNNSSDASLVKHSSLSHRISPFILFLQKKVLVIFKDSVKCL